MAATTSNTYSTTSATNNPLKMLLYYTVIIACITSQFLSVDAIRCHQCNSHLDEDCNSLSLKSPRPSQDERYLKDCEVQQDAQAFCRKTVLTIEVTKEHRVIRGCGWIPERGPLGNNTCFTADNEGYKQTICSCLEDGCNASTSLFISKWSVLAVSGVSVFVATVLRRY